MHLKSPRVTKQLRTKRGGRPNLSPISAKSSLPFYLLSAVVTLALCAAIIDSVIFSGSSDFKWQAILGLPVLGGLAIHSLWMFFDRRPFLLLDDTGILDRRSGIHKTPWTEFSSARLVGGFRGVFILHLEPHNSDQWVQQRLSRTRRFFAKLTGVTTCYIPISFYDKNPVDIYRYVITRVPGGWL